MRKKGLDVWLEDEQLREVVYAIGNTYTHHCDDDAIVPVGCRREHNRRKKFLQKLLAHLENELSATH